MAGGGGDDGGAAQARADEQARQQRIREGTQRINEIFDGYTRTRGNNFVDPKAYVDGATYYTEDGKEYVYRKPVEKTPQEGVGGRNANMAVRTSQGDVVGGGGGAPAGSVADSFALPPGKLYASTETTSTPGQFGDAFFGGRRQAYLDYANPQLNDQYKNAQEQLTYALDRSGMLDSSYRAKKEAELQKLYETNRRSVADQALGYENQARTNVEDARTGLIQTLNATGDAEGAANSALARSAALSAPDTYSPLGQLFATFTSGLGTQAGLERAADYSNGAIAPAYNTGLFGSKKKSVQTTA